MADIQLFKIADNASPENGDILTFTIFAANNGPDSSGQVSIKDYFPENGVLIGGTPSTGSFYTSGTWLIDNIEAGRMESLQVQWQLPLIPGVSAVITNPIPQHQSFFGSDVLFYNQSSILVGVPRTSQGGFYGHGRVDLVTTNGTLLRQYTNPAGTSNELFGTALALLEDGTIAVGAPGIQGTTNSSQGSVYLFDPAGPLVGTITNPVPLQGGSFFGTELAALSSNRLVIGNWEASPQGQLYAGEAYLYDASGVLITVITNPTPASSELFGLDICRVSSNRFAVSSPLDTLTGGGMDGRVYLYNLQGELEAEVDNPDPGGTYFFGKHLAPFRDGFLIGADERAFLYRDGAVQPNAFVAPGLYTEKLNGTVTGMGTNLVLAGRRGSILAFTPEGRFLETISIPRHDPTPSFGSVIRADDGRILCSDPQANVTDADRAGMLFVLATDLNGCRVINRAAVTGVDAIDPNRLNNTGTAWAVAGRQAQLSISKYVDPSSKHFADPCSFTITLHNEGPDKATEIFIKELIPNGLLMSSVTVSRGYFTISNNTWFIEDLLAGGTEQMEVYAEALSPLAPILAYPRTGTFYNATLKTQSVTTNYLYTGGTLQNPLSGQEIKLTNVLNSIHNEFGKSIAVDEANNRLFISAHSQDLLWPLKDTGIVVLYDLNGNFIRKIYNPLPQTNDLFGFSLAMLGTNLLAAAPDGVYDKGPGKVFLLNSVGSVLNIFTNPTPLPGDFFGGSLSSISSTQFVVGAYGARLDGVETPGEAFLFNQHGEALLTLTNPVPLNGTSFGWAVLDLGETIVVSAPLQPVDGFEQAGTVYVYSKAGALLATIPNPRPYRLGQFGITLTAYRDQFFLAGSYSGHGYLCSTDGRIIADISYPTRESSGGMGYYMAVLQNRYIYTGYDINGSAYLFDLQTARRTNTAFIASRLQADTDSQNDLSGAPFTIAIDNDSDGLFDWEDPDDDNDGSNDQDEIAAGSNPLEAGSVFELSASAVSNHGALIYISWQSATGKLYTILGSEEPVHQADEGDWRILSDNIPGTGATLQRALYNTTPSAPDRYFTLRVRPE